MAQFLSCPHVRWAAWQSWRGEPACFGALTWQPDCSTRGRRALSGTGIFERNFALLLRRPLNLPHPPHAFHAYRTAPVLERTKGWGSLSRAAETREHDQQKAAPADKTIMSVPGAVRKLSLWTNKRDQPSHARRWSIPSSLADATFTFGTVDGPLHRPRPVFRDLADLRSCSGVMAEMKSGSTQGGGGVLPRNAGPGRREGPRLGCGTAGGRRGRCRQRTDHWEEERSVASGCRETRRLFGGGILWQKNATSPGPMGRRRGGKTCSYFAPQAASWARRVIIERLMPRSARSRLVRAFSSRTVWR